MRDSITLPTILTFTLLSGPSAFIETLVPFKLSSSSSSFRFVDNVRQLDYICMEKNIVRY